MVKNTIIPILPHRKKITTTPNLAMKDSRDGVFFTSVSNGVAVVALFSGKGRGGVTIITPGGSVDVDVGVGAKCTVGTAGAVMLGRGPDSDCKEGVRVKSTARLGIGEGDGEGTLLTVGVDACVSPG